MDEPRAADLDDAQLVADILAEAFSDDPVMNWMFGGARPIGDMFRILVKHAYLRNGFGNIVGDNAAAVWLPARKRLGLSRWRQFELAARVFANSGAGGVRRMAATSKILGANHPKEPHYYLFAVGVRRKAQGSGLGGALVRKGLSYADEAGAAAYLENSRTRNTPLYERLGFVAREFIPLPDGAPPLLAMLRPAQKGPAA